HGRRADDRPAGVIPGHPRPGGRGEAAARPDQGRGVGEDRGAVAEDRAGEVEEAEDEGVVTEGEPVRILDRESPVGPVEVTTARSSDPAEMPRNRGVRRLARGVHYFGAPNTKSGRGPPARPTYFPAPHPTRQREPVASAAGFLFSG